MNQKFHWHIPLIVLLICSIMLSACNTNVPPGSDDPSGTVSSEPEETTPTREDPTQEDRLTLYQNGAPLFDVISMTNLRAGTVRATSISELYQSFCYLIGETANSLNAPKYRLDIAYMSDPERIPILIGNTCFPESEQALKEASLDEYGYRVINRKIVVYGHTLEEIQTAGNELIQMLNKTIRRDDSGKMLLEVPVSMSKTYHSKIAAVSMPELTVSGSTLFFDDGDDSRLWVAEACTADDFRTYINTLQNAGFALYAQNEIKNNLFATLTKDSVIADVWLANDGCLRVTAESGFDTLPENSGSYTKICESGMTLVSSTLCEVGMCLFFRLEDGRFVVIDGGCTATMGNVLYQELRKQAPDPEHVTIACWIFTHSHADHIGAFQGIAKNYNSVYASKLTIESFLFNFAGSEQAMVSTQNLKGSDDEIRHFVKSYFPNAKVYKPHPGNETTFANMRIEILGTHESYIKKTYPEDHNACCLFLKITIGDQVICIEADADATDNQVLEQNYGDYLKCDILQADHHGYFGGVASTNQLFSPEIVIYFTTDDRAAYYMTLDYNQQLVDRKKNPNFKEYIVVDTRVTYLPLPYTAGNSQILG